MKKVISESEKKGKWKSWYENYYLKYKQVFDYQLETLYMSDICLFEELVHNMDFEEIQVKIDEIEKNIKIEQFDKVINKSIETLGYKGKFEIYLLYGFGHVNGTAGQFKLPFVYYGLENFRSENFMYVIPHEINHMVRFDTLQLHKKYASIQEMSVADILVNEGLGVTFPLILDKENKVFDENEFRKSIGVREEQFKRLLLNEKKYLLGIREIWDKKITKEIWENWFVINNSSVGITSGIGYFIGGKIVQSLIKHGVSIEELTKLPSDDVVKMYRENNDI